MAKQFPKSRRQGSPSAVTKLPIFTLSGGVSKQAQSKRLPTEAENMDNALVSLERSFEKRPGFDIVKQSTFTGDINYAVSIPDAQRLDLYDLEHTAVPLVATYTRSGSVVTITKTTHGLLVGNTVDIVFTSGGALSGTYAIVTRPDANTFTINTVATGTITTSNCTFERDVDYWFYWFNINADNRFFIVIDYSSAYTDDSNYQKLLYIYKLNTDGTWTNNTPSVQTAAVISTTTRNYITYGSIDNYAKDVLKATTIGNSIVILNTLVKAGFSSPDTTTHYLYNGDGTASTTVDTKGNKVTYYSSARYTKGANSQWYLNTLTGDSRTISFSGTLAIGTAITMSSAPTLPTNVIHGTPTSPQTNPSAQNKFYIIKDASNWAVVTGWVSAGTVYTVEKLIGSISTGNAVTIYSGYFPEVEDFIWYDTSEPWFGQSMADFSEIRFPPEYAETIANNGITLNSVSYDNEAKTMLNSLYGTNSGNGKVYFTSAPYLNFLSGYYRVISSTSKPYTKKIRTPDAFSVFDERRMPQKIKFDLGSATPWSAAPIAWEPRTSGDRYSNPGPSIFLSTDKLTPVNRAINAITTFRDRLYMAAEDVVFTSQLGVYEDLWISDPSSIVATDPIDIRASSSTFNEIKTLTPFKNYLFITTLGNVQYELKGSQNQITPLTAEISPTAFYSTATLVEPQTMGSLIYFLDSSKLYLYLSTETTDLAVAQELTITCSDYLPTVQRNICVSPAQNTIVIIDNDNLNYLYFHISRFAGERNIQNAFFRYILNTNDSILSNQAYNDYLYAIIKRPTTSAISSTQTTVGSTPTGTAVQTNRYYLENTFMRSLDPDVPRIDRKIKLTLTANNSSYSYITNQTTINLPVSFPYSDISNIQVITDSTWSTDISGDRSYEIVSPVAYTIKDTYISLILDGRFVPASGTNPQAVDYTITRTIDIGLKYTMNIELSTLFVRDQNNNVIDGVLNLRTITTRHKKTGNYDISVSNRSRTPVISSFTNQVVGDNENLLQLSNYEEEGEFVTNVLSYSDSTSIKITSDYPTPVNIVNIEVKGKFIQKYTSLNT